MRLPFLAQRPSSLDKKIYSRLISSSLLALAPLMMLAPPALAGETVVFPGAPLATINWAADSLGPSGSDTGQSNSLSGNSVTVESGLIGGHVMGSINNLDNTPINDNTVTLKAATVGGNAYGAFTDNGSSAANNAVIINGAQVNGDVYGALSDSGVVTHNQVTLLDGSVVGQIFGGQSINNTVSGNSVIISGGSVDADVFGGESSFGGVTGNTVTISGGAANGTIYGGYSLNGVATGNTVNFNGGTVGSNVYGGTSWNSTATGNTVNLNGGTVDFNVYGGYSNNSSATGNTVTLYETTLNLSSNIYGGDSGAGDDAFSGNIFHVLKPQSGAVNSVQNFQFYRFVLPVDLATPMLTTTDLNLADSFGGQAPVVDQIGLVGGAPLPQVDDTYTLIASNNLITQGAYTGNQVVGKKGLTLLYDMEAYIDASGQNLMLKVLSAPVVNPETEALSEGRLAGLALVNQGSNLVAGAGLTSALASSCQSGPGQVATFLTLSGSSSRYNTGSHVDVNGLSVMAGLSWKRPLNLDQLVLGAFVEAGRGDYESFNTFTHYSSIKANGDSDYFGGGFLARYGVTDCQDTGLYGETSFRAGRTNTDFYSPDLVSGDGQRASYDSSATYYGAHGGLGYVLGLSERSKLDLSTKYLWLRQGGDQVVTAGDTINLEASTSHRWRNGARYSHDFNAANGALWRPYVGAALDYEFDGEAGATAYGYHLPAPSLKGGTAVGEVGLSFKPASASNLRLDLGLEGYAGKREGVSGSFRVKVEF